MAERPPSRPRVAWEQKAAPRERRSPQEPYEVTMVEPLRTEFDWSPLYEERGETMDFIMAFVHGPSEDKDLKIKFLYSIYTLCRAARNLRLSQCLLFFCHIFDLVENIKMLLEKEPRDQLSTEVWENAMLAIVELSSVERVLEGREERLLQAAFSRVFFLPPEEEMQGLERNHYHRALETTKRMLRNLVQRCPLHRVTELVQIIFQMLLNFTDSETAAVRKRALEMIGELGSSLYSLEMMSAWKSYHRGVYEPIMEKHVQISNLGTVLGRLLLFSSSTGEISSAAYQALQKLSAVIRDHQRRSSRKNKKPDFHWQPESPFHLPTTRDFAMEFAECLPPRQMTDIVLASIEALRDSSIFDKRAVRDMLDLFMRYPDLWLADVPKLMSCIQQHLGHITTESARQSVEALLAALTHLDPTQAVLSLLKFSATRDSNGAAMWEVMLCVPQALEKILEELLSHLQGRKTRSPGALARDKACLLHLALMASGELQQLGNTSQSHPSLAIACLLLRRLFLLSQRPDVASKLQGLLPQLMELLQHGQTTAIKMNVLLIFRNVKGSLERKKASPIAVQLAEKLLPLFDAESSRLRELSISLFRELLETVVWKDKKRMKEHVRRGLLPLFFHTCEETHSVCEPSSSAAQRKGPADPAPAGAEKPHRHCPPCPARGPRCEYVHRCGLPCCPCSCWRPRPGGSIPVPPGRAQETPRGLGPGTSQLPKGRITPGRKPRGGATRSPSPGCGAISQLLPLCRPPGKPSLLQQSSSAGKSSRTWCSPRRCGWLWRTRCCRTGAGCRNT